MTGSPFFFQRQTATAPTDISTTGLLGFWRMNEGTGTAVSDETGVHNGTAVGTPTWVVGKSGQALQFDGSSQYVNITKTAALNMTSAAVSILVWINPDSTSTAMRIVCLPRSETGGTEKYSLQIGVNTLSFKLSKVSVWGIEAAAAFTTAGSWSHVAGVYNGTDMRVYVNGTHVGTPVSHTENILTSTNGDLQIGRFGPTYPGWFDGIIDDVRLYNRAVSAAEVATVYGLG